MLPSLKNSPWNPLDFWSEDLLDRQWNRYFCFLGPIVDDGHGCLLCCLHPFHSLWLLSRHEEQSISRISNSHLWRRPTGNANSFQDYYRASVSTTGCFYGNTKAAIDNAQWMSLAALQRNYVQSPWFKFYLTKLQNFLSSTTIWKWKWKTRSVGLSQRARSTDSCFRVTTCMKK